MSAADGLVGTMTCLECGAAFALASEDSRAALQSALDVHLAHHRSDALRRAIEVKRMHQMAQAAQDLASDPLLPD